MMMDRQSPVRHAITAALLVQGQQKRPVLVVNLPQKDHYLVRHVYVLKNTTMICLDLFACSATTAVIPVAMDLLVQPAHHQSIAFSMLPLVTAPVFLLITSLNRPVLLVYQPA